MNLVLINGEKVYFNNSNIVWCFNDMYTGRVSVNRNVDPFEVLSKHPNSFFGILKDGVVEKIIPIKNVLYIEGCRYGESKS